MSASVPRGTPGRGTQTGSVMVVRTGPDHMAGFQEFDSPEATRFAKNTSVTRKDDGQTLVVPVESDRSAVPASRLVRFSGPLPEPDVRLPPHPALHERR